MEVDGGEGVEKGTAWEEEGLDDHWSVFVFRVCVSGFWFEGFCDLRLLSGGWTDRDFGLWKGKEERKKVSEGGERTLIDYCPARRSRRSRRRAGRLRWRRWRIRLWGRSRSSWWRSTISGRLSRRSCGSLGLTFVFVWLRWFVFRAYRSIISRARWRMISLELFFSRLVFPFDVGCFYTRVG